MASSNAGGRGRKSTSFMRQLVQLISDHPDVISFVAASSMLLLSCMRREDSLPALGEPIAA